MFLSFILKFNNLFLTEIKKLSKIFLWKLKYLNKEVFVKKIKNKSILITGANSGIGLGLAKELLKHKNIVYATYNTNNKNLNKN